MTKSKKIEQEKELQKLRKDMFRIFSGWNTNGLTLDHYRRIAEIVNEVE